MAEKVTRGEHVDPEEQFERRRRAQVVYFAIAFTITLSSWILAGSRLGELIEYRFGAPGLLQLVTIGGLITSIGALAWVYLQTGFKAPSGVDREIYRAREAMRRLKNGADAGVDINQEVAGPDSELTLLKKRLERLEVSPPQSAFDLDQIVSGLSVRVLDKSSDDLIRLASMKLDSRLAQLKSLDAVERSFTDTRARIYSEIGRLNLQGNLNLVIGMVISISGVVALGYYVSQEFGDKIDVKQYAMHFIPRLSLVVLIQAFAFFFLKLYKSSLDERKYYQNELTNIEQRHAAINLASADGEDERRELVSILATVERNHVLAKGTTTLELERARIEAQGGALEAVKALAPMISKLK